MYAIYVNRVILINSRGRRRHIICSFINKKNKRFIDRDNSILN